MEPPEVLAIHAVPNPTAKVRQVGFAIDDPYVEQVWAGVVGRSALPELRRLHVLWCEREPAVVDLRELGQFSAWARRSHGADARGAPSNASSASGCPTGLPGDDLGVRTEVAPLSGRQLARLPEW